MCGCAVNLRPDKDGEWRHCRSNVLFMGKTQNFRCNNALPILKIKLWSWFQNKVNEWAEGL